MATATVCARFGMECVIYMGAEDVRRQALNVFRIRMLGAKVIGCRSSIFHAPKLNVCIFDDRLCRCIRVPARSRTP